MKILIEKLTFDAIIGILPQERITAQTLLIDCHIEYDYLEKNFINYAHVAQAIETIVQQEQFYLLEEALDHLGETLKNLFPPIKELQLTLRKPNILQNCTVGVENRFIF
ncbi:MAG: dihydroneopterin aldolase [Sulfuricurvum sp.]